jgi:TolB protein
MMFKYFRFFALITACTIFYGIQPFASGQIRVRKSAGDFTRNPTLVFKGVKNSLSLSAAMNSMLKACGWFNVSAGGVTDYTLQGSYFGGSLTLELRQNAAVVSRFSLNSNGAGEREIAKSAVDALLNRLFKIKGICRSRIAFCVDNGNGAQNIYSCDIDGSNIKRITSYRGMCVEPEWMPDGKSLLYTRYNRASTYVIQTVPAAGKSRIVAAYKGMNLGASPDPSGKYLALIMSRDGQVDLYIKSLTTRARRRLTRNQAPEASPCWSPSGKSICYTSGQAGSPRLYVISVSGGTPRRLPTSGGEAVNPDWSKDNQIVYSARSGGQYTIATLDLNGQKPGKIVIRAAGDWESPSWGPDNRHIVCYRTYGGRSGIYMVDTWTGKARSLVRLRNNASMPCWSNIIR